MTTIPTPPPTSLITNGNINPLIRSLPQLREVAGDQLPQALWTMRSALDTAKIPCPVPCVHPIPDAAAELVVHTYFGARRRLGFPFSRSERKPLLPDIYTPAQFLARHGNGDCHAACEDFTDLCACLRMVGDYNDFDNELCRRELHAFNRPAWYGPDNTNTGKDAFQWQFGWEGSLVLYVSIVTCQLAFPLLSHDFSTLTTYSAEELSAEFQALGQRCRADETDPVRQWSNGTLSLEWRFWWD